MIGPVIGLLPALLLGLAEDPRTALYVLILYAVVQTVESYLLTPLVQERVLELPPFATIATQVLFAWTLGQVGLLIAVPSGHEACAQPGVAGCARIGCSGWQYKHWRGDFYPPDVPTTKWFAYYAARFDTVEINNSFYRLPEAETFARWRERAPSGFLYAVKASRFLTHMKKLKNPEEPVDRLFRRMHHLGRRLGPVLYQLPPGFKLDRARLEHFLHILPRGVGHVIEFRDPSWYRDEVSALLERHGVVRCLHDMKGSATGRERIGPFAYVRFHGATGTYSGGYAGDRLARWAEWLHEQQSAGIDVYAYFNNDVGGHAPRDALTLRRLVEETA